MADTKISALSDAGPLVGTEVVPIVQSGATVKATVVDVANKVTDAYSGFALPGGTGYGIKMRSPTAAYGWRDITADVIVRGTGTDPQFSTYRGNIRQYEFAVNDYVYQTFHIPHDWVPGTDIYIHAHWSHVSASVTTGSVTWQFEVTWAKGFDQAAFLTPITASVTQNASTTQYQHMVAEVQLTAASPSASQIDTDIIETDGLFLVRTLLSANSMDGSATPFLHTVDLHYQSTNMATPNKSPNFYYSES